MTEKRFMVDDAGTLIDMQTRDTFDYVSDACDLLNELNNENTQLKEEIKDYNDTLARLEETNQQCKDYNAKLYANGMNNDRQCQKIIRELENENTHIKHLIQVAYETERTHIGRNVLKQLLEAIE